MNTATKQAQHTPGPWFIFEARNTLAALAKARGY